MRLFHHAFLLVPLLAASALAVPTPRHLVVDGPTASPRKSGTMIVQIVVAVLLALAVAPAMQADSRSDFCESVRLRDLAFERWAEDAPDDRDLLRLHEMRASVAEETYCSPDSGFASTRWWWATGKVTILGMLHSVLGEMESMADVHTGLTSRQMSVETLLLFTEARIYAQRAFLGALEEARSLEKANSR